MGLFSQTPSPSHAVQLATTAVVSVAAGAGVVLAYQRLQQEARLSRLKRSIPRADDDGAREKGEADREKDRNEDARNAALARRAQAGDFDEELIAEQLARNRAFLSEEGLGRLREAFVVVVGCGGVGSHCAAALARSGVSRLRLVDFDQVTLSSLNRHAVAGLADVGLPKVRCLERRLAAVTPWVRFDLRLGKMDEQSAPELLGPWREEGDDGRQPDFVVDAIDNIDTKVQLLQYCHARGLRVISSMGAGCKSEPTRIAVGDIGTSTADGLSRATRRRLKLLGVTSGIPVVYSTEAPGEGKAQLLPLAEDEFDKGAVGDLGVLPDFRVRILPVLGTMPAVFGYTLANHIILTISGYPTDYTPFKGRDKMYDAIQAFIQSSEEKLVRASAGSAEVAVGLKTPITVGDIAFLVEEVYRGRSVVTGLATRLVLIRWRRPAASTLVQIEQQKSAAVGLGDLVCMTRDEAVRHQKEVLQGSKAPEELYGAETVAAVESRMREVRAYERYR